MAGTVSSDQTLVDAGEATTNWFSSGFTTALGIIDDLRIQGTYALQGRVSNTTAWGGASGSASGGTTYDLTDGRHIFVWYQTTTSPSDDVMVNGGVALWASSDAVPTITGTTPVNGPTNSKTWFISGSDVSLTGGWTCYAIDAQSTATLALGTLTTSAVRNMGVRKKTTSTVATSTRDTIIDVIRVGTGLQVIDGTSGSPGTFEDFYVKDSNISNAYGVLTTTAGIYYVAGKLKFGNTGQTGITYFKDINKVLVFRDFPVASTFYEFVAVGAASYTTTLQLGNYSGGLASDGCTVKGASARKICSYYSQAYADANSNLYSGSLVGAGQSFTGDSGTLTSVILWLKKTLAPTGTAVAKIYNHSGVYGTSSIPTGAALATSDTLDVSTLTTTSALVTLKFSGSNQIKLVNGTYYIVTLEYSGGNATNYLMVGTDASSPTHGGNYSTLTGTTWTAVSGTDAIFFINTTDIPSCWTFTSNNAYTVTKLYNSTFSEVKSAIFNSASEMRYCSFSNFASITPNGMTIDNCTFQNVRTLLPISGTYGLIINATSEVTDKITNCTFTNCNRAIKITAAGTYAFNNLKFSNNTYDIENSSTGTVTINATNGANPVTYINTGGGSTSIVNTKTLTATCKNESGYAIEGIRVRIETDPTGTLITEGSTNSLGKLTYSAYNYTVDTNVKVIARRKGYINNQALDTITVNGLSLPFTMVRDKSVNLP